MTIEQINYTKRNLNKLNAEELLKVQIIIMQYLLTK
jgi:hypothetical protein